MSNVDELIEQTPLDLVLGHYGLPTSGSNAREYRMKCVFNEACSDSQYGNLAIKLDVAKQIYCHSCSVRGNLLTLIHGLETGRPPEGGKVRGQEFKNAITKLKELNGLVDSPVSNAAAQANPKAPSVTSIPTTAPMPSQQVSDNAVQPSLDKNVPLHRHDKEAARALADLHKDLITDISQMSPEAAAYVRKREHWMTSELMQKWGCGWIPGNGRSLFRKSYFVYTHRNTRGEIVSYSGRDLTFESKWEKWIKAGKPEGKKPSKHRYVSGFKRGAELYGGFASRLDEPQVMESLEQNGLVVVEGMNDVIRLDELGVCAVGLCSNRATEQQVEMLTKFSRQVANSRVLLIPDCDGEEESGFKELLWKLNENSLRIAVGVSRKMHGGHFYGLQPENFTKNDWYTIVAYLGDDFQADV